MLSKRNCGLFISRKVKFSKIMNSSICTCNLQRNSIKDSGFYHSHVTITTGVNATSNSSGVRKSRRNVTSWGVEQPNCKNLWLHHHLTPSDSDIRSGRTKDTTPADVNRKSQCLKNFSTRSNQPVRKQSQQ